MGYFPVRAIPFGPRVFHFLLFSFLLYNFKKPIIYNNIFACDTNKGDKPNLNQHDSVGLQLKQAETQLAVSCCERYLICSLLCPETDWKIRVERQGYVWRHFTDFNKRCFDVSFLTSICVNNYFETVNLLNKLMS